MGRLKLRLKWNNGYYRVQIVKGQGLFGGIERNYKKNRFVLPVENKK